MARSLHVLLAAVCAAGATCPVSAQVTWEGRIRYRLQGNDSIPPGSTLPLIAPGTSTVVVQVGAFNMIGLGVGEANHGLYSWQARINSTGLQAGAGETLGVNPASARIAPFYWQATSFAGYVAEGGTAIYGPFGQNMFSPFRCVFNGTASAWWVCGDSMPTGPNDWFSGGIQMGWGDRGADAYADVYRFQVTLTSATGPDIIVTPVGTTQPIKNWGPFQGGECDYRQDFVGIVTQNNATLPFANQPLTITRCPLQITSQPAPLTVGSGQSATFTVAAESTAGITGYQWRRGNVPLADDGHISGSTGPTLTINPTSSVDRATYSVVVSVPCGMLTSSTAFLHFYCPADWDRDLHVDPSDVAAFINDWMASLIQGTTVGDFDHNGVVNPADISAFVTAWTATIGATC